MYVFLIILIVIFSLLLTLIVLVQNSKGGGLAAGFQSSNQIVGVRKTTDFLEKATWGLAAAIVVLSIITVGVKSNAPKEVNDSEIKEQSLDLNKQMQQKTATPNFGETAPAQEKQAATATETPKEEPAAQPAAQPEKK